MVFKAQNVCTSLKKLEKLKRAEGWTHSFKAQIKTCWYLLGDRLYQDTILNLSEIFHETILVSIKDRVRLKLVEGKFETIFSRQTLKKLNLFLGRASITPCVDVFITLLQMGTSGYKRLTDERKENFKKLREEMGKIAEKYGERLLEVKNNPISIGKHI